MEDSSRPQKYIRAEWEVLPDYCMNGLQDAVLPPVSLFGIDNSGIILLDLPQDTHMLYLSYTVDIAEHESDIASVVRIPGENDIYASARMMVWDNKDVVSSFHVEIDDTLRSSVSILISDDITGTVIFPDSSRLRLAYSVPIGEHEKDAASIFTIPYEYDTVSEVRMTTNERFEEISLAHIFNFDEIVSQGAVPLTDDITSQIQVLDSSPLHITFSVPYGVSETDVPSSVLIPYSSDMVSLARIQADGLHDLPSEAEIHIFSDIDSYVGILYSYDFTSSVTLSEKTWMEIVYTPMEIPVQVYTTEVVKDAYTTQSSVYYNAGDKTFVQTGLPHDSAKPSTRAYLSFDISHIADLLTHDCVAKSIMLFLPAQSNISGYTLSIYAYDRKWEELGITWANQYGLTEANLLMTYTVPQGKSNYIEIPIDDLILDAVEKGKTTWSISLCSSKSFTFGSKEGKNPAKIILRYIDMNWNGQPGETELFNEVYIMPVSENIGTAHIWYGKEFTGEAEIEQKSNLFVSSADIYIHASFTGELYLDQKDDLLPSLAKLHTFKDAVSKTKLEYKSSDLWNKAFILNPAYDIDHPTLKSLVYIDDRYNLLDSVITISPETVLWSKIELDQKYNLLPSAVQVFKENEIVSSAYLDYRNTDADASVYIAPWSDILSAVQFRPVENDIYGVFAVPALYDTYGAVTITDVTLDMPASVLIEWPGYAINSEISLAQAEDMPSEALIEWPGEHVTAGASIVHARTVTAEAEITWPEASIIGTAEIKDRGIDVVSFASILLNNEIDSIITLTHGASVVSATEIVPITADAVSEAYIDETNRFVESAVRVQQYGENDLDSGMFLDERNIPVFSCAEIAFLGDSDIEGTLEMFAPVYVESEVYIPKHDERDINPSILVVQRDDITDAVSHVFIDDSVHDDRLVSGVVLFRVEKEDIDSKADISNPAESDLDSSIDLHMHTNLDSTVNILATYDFASSADIYQYTDLDSIADIPPRTEIASSANLAERRILMLSHMLGQIPIRVINCPIVQDSYVNPDRPYLNYGDLTYTRISTDPDTGRSFYTADLSGVLNIPDLSWIVGIEFEVVAQQRIYPDQWFAFYEQDWYWNEYSITYANRPMPGLFLQNGVYTPLAVGNKGGIVRFDVTESFLPVIEAIWWGYKWGTTFSFDIVSNYINTFASKESKNPPKLRIRYRDYDWTGEVGIYDMDSQVRIQRNGETDFISSADISWSVDTECTAEIEPKTYDFPAAVYIEPLEPGALLSKVYTESNGMSFDSEVYIINTFGYSPIVSSAEITRDFLYSETELDYRNETLVSSAFVRRDFLYSETELEYKGCDIDSKLTIPYTYDITSRADVVYVSDMDSQFRPQITEHYVGLEITAHFPRTLIVSYADIYHKSDISGEASVVIPGANDLYSEAALEDKSRDLHSVFDVIWESYTTGVSEIINPPQLASSLMIDERNFPIDSEITIYPDARIHSEVYLDFKSNDFDSEIMVFAPSRLVSSADIAEKRSNDLDSSANIPAISELNSCVRIPYVSDALSKALIYEDLALVSMVSTGVEELFLSQATIVYTAEIDSIVHLLSTFVSMVDIWHGIDIGSSVYLDYKSNDLNSFVRVMRRDASDMISEYHGITDPVFELELDTTPPEFEAFIDTSQWTEKAPFVYITVNILNCKDWDDPYAYQIRFEGAGFIPTLVQPVYESPGWYVNQRIFRLKTLTDGPMYVQVRVRDDVWNESEHSPVFREYFPIGKDFEKSYVPYIDLELDTTPPIPRVVLNGGAEEIWDPKLVFEFFDIPDDMVGWKVWSDDFDERLNLSKTYEDAPWFAVVSQFIASCSSELGTKSFHFAFIDDVGNEGFLYIEVKFVPREIENEDRAHSHGAAVIDLALYKAYKTKTYVTTDHPVTERPRVFEVFNKDFNTFDDGTGFDKAIIWPYAYDHGMMLDLQGHFVIENLSGDAARTVYNAHTSTFGYDFGASAFERALPSPKALDTSKGHDSNLSVLNAPETDNAAALAYVRTETSDDDTGRAFEESSNIIWAHDMFRNRDDVHSVWNIEYDVARAWGEALTETLHGEPVTVNTKIVTELPVWDFANTLYQSTTDTMGYDYSTHTSSFTWTESIIKKEITAFPVLFTDIPVSDHAKSIDLFAADIPVTQPVTPKDWIPVREFISCKFFDTKQEAVTEHPVYDVFSVLDDSSNDVSLLEVFEFEDNVILGDFRFLDVFDEFYDCVALLRYTPYERTPEIRSPYIKVGPEHKLYPKHPVRPFDPEYPVKMQGVESPHYPEMTIRNPEWGDVIRRGSPEFPENYTESDTISFFKTISYTVSLGEKTYTPEYTERQVYDLYGEEAGTIHEMDDLIITLNTGVYLISVEYDTLLADNGFLTEILPEEHEFYPPYRKTNGFHQVYVDGTKLIFRNKFMTDTAARPKYTIKIQSFAFLESDFYKDCKPFWVTMKRPSTLLFYSDPTYPSYRKYPGDALYPQKLTYSEQKEEVTSGSFEWLQPSKIGEEYSFASYTVTLYTGSKDNTKEYGTYECAIALSGYTGGIGITAKQGNTYLDAKDGKIIYTVSKENESDSVTLKYTDIRTDSENHKPDSTYTLYCYNEKAMYTIADAYTWPVWVKETTGPYMKYEQMLLPDGTKTLWLPNGTEPIIVPNECLTLDGLYTVDIYYNRGCDIDPFGTLRDIPDPELISIYEELKNLKDNTGYVQIHNAGDARQHFTEHTVTEIPLLQRGYYDELRFFDGADGERLLTDEAFSCEAVLVYTDIPGIDSNFAEKRIVYPGEPDFPMENVLPGDMRYPHKWITSSDPDYPKKTVFLESADWLAPEDPEYPRNRYKNPLYGETITLEDADYPFAVDAGPVIFLTENGLLNPVYTEARSPYIYEKRPSETQRMSFTSVSLLGWSSKETQVPNPYDGLVMYPDDPDYPNDLYKDRDEKPPVYSPDSVTVDGSTGYSKTGMHFTYISADGILHTGYRDPSSGEKCSWFEDTTEAIACTITGERGTEYRISGEYMHFDIYCEDDNILIGKNVRNAAVTAGKTYHIKPSGVFNYSGKGYFSEILEKNLRYIPNADNSKYIGLIYDSNSYFFTEYTRSVYVSGDKNLAERHAYLTDRLSLYHRVEIAGYTRNEPVSVTGTSGAVYYNNISVYKSVHPKRDVEIQVPDGDTAIIKWLGTEPVAVPVSNHKEYIPVYHLGGTTGIQQYDFYLNSGCADADFAYVLTDSITKRINIPKLEELFARYEDASVASYRETYAADRNVTVNTAFTEIPAATEYVRADREDGAVIGDAYKYFCDSVLQCEAVLAYSIPEETAEGIYNIPFTSIFPGENGYPVTVLLPGDEDYPTKVVRPGDLDFPTHIVPNDMYGKPILPTDYDYPREGDEGHTGEPIERFTYTRTVFPYRYYAGVQQQDTYSASDNAYGMQDPYYLFSDDYVLETLDPFTGNGYFFTHAKLNAWGGRETQKTFYPTSAVFNSIVTGGSLRSWSNPFTSSAYEPDIPLLSEGDIIDAEITSFTNNIVSDANPYYPVKTNFTTMYGGVNFPFTADRDYWASDPDWQKNLPFDAARFAPVSFDTKNFYTDVVRTFSEWNYDFSYNVPISGYGYSYDPEYAQAYFRAKNDYRKAVGYKEYSIIAAFQLNQMFSPQPDFAFMRLHGNYTNSDNITIDGLNNTNLGNIPLSYPRYGIVDFNIIIKKAVKNPLYDKYRRKFFNVLDDYDYVILPDGKSPIYIPKGTKPVTKYVNGPFIEGMTDINIYHSDSCSLDTDFDLNWTDESKTVDRFIYTVLNTYSEGHIRYIMAGDSQAAAENSAQDVKSLEKLRFTEPIRMFRGDETIVTDYASSCEAVLRYESNIVSRIEIPNNTLRFKVDNPKFGWAITSKESDYPLHEGDTDYGKSIPVYTYSSVQYVNLAIGTNPEMQTIVKLEPAQFSQDERLPLPHEIGYRFTLYARIYETNPFPSYRYPEVTFEWADTRGFWHESKITWSNFPKERTIAFSDFNRRRVRIKLYVPYNDPKKRPILYDPDLLALPGYTDQRPISISVYGYIEEQKINPLYKRPKFTWRYAPEKPYLKDYHEEYEWIDVVFDKDCVIEPFSAPANRTDELAARLAEISNRQAWAFREGFAGNRVTDFEWSFNEVIFGDSADVPDYMYSDKYDVFTTEDPYCCETIIRTEPYDYIYNALDFDAEGNIIVPKFYFSREPFHFLAASSCILTGDEWKSAWEPHANMGPFYAYIGREYLYTKKPFAFLDATLLNPHDLATDYEQSYNTLDFDIKLKQSDYLYTDKLDDYRYEALEGVTGQLIDIPVCDIAAAIEYTENNLFFAHEYYAYVKFIFERTFADMAESSLAGIIEMPLFDVLSETEHLVTDVPVANPAKYRDIHWSWRDTYLWQTPYSVERAVNDLYMNDVFAVIESPVIPDISLYKELYAVIRLVRDILVKDFGEAEDTLRTELPLYELASVYESSVQDVLFKAEYRFEDTTDMPYCFTVYDEGSECEWVQIVKYNFIIPWYECDPLKPKIVLPPKQVGKSLILNEKAVEYFRGQSCIGEPPGGWEPVDRAPQPADWTPSDPQSGLVIWKYAGDPNAPAEPGHAPKDPRKTPVPNWPFMIKRADTGRVVKPQIKTGRFEERYEANPLYGQPVKPGDEDYPYAETSPKYGTSITTDDPLYDSIRLPEILVRAELTEDDPAFSYWTTNAYGYVNAFLEPGEYIVSEPVIKSPWTPKSETVKTVSVVNTYDKITLEFFNDAPDSTKDNLPKPPVGGTYPNPPKKGEPSVPGIPDKNGEHFKGYGEPDPENPPPGWRGEELAGIAKLTIIKEIPEPLAKEEDWNELEFTVSNDETKRYKVVNRENTPNIIVSETQIKFEHDISQWFTIDKSEIVLHITESSPPRGMSISSDNAKGKYVTYKSGVKSATVLFRDEKIKGDPIKEQPPKDPDNSFKLTILKTVTYGNDPEPKPLAGARFTVYFPESDEVITVTTDSKGEATVEIGGMFEKLNLNSLYPKITEISAPAGVTFDTTPKTVLCMLMWGKKTVEFTNHKEGEEEKEPPLVLVPDIPQEVTPCITCGVECEVLRPEFYADNIRVTDIDYKIYDLYKEKVEKGEFKEGQKLTRRQAEQLIMERDALYPMEERTEIPVYLDGEGTYEEITGRESLDKILKMNPYKKGFASIIYDFRERPSWLKLISGDTILDETGSQKKIDIKAADYHYVQDTGYFYVQWDPTDPYTEAMSPDLLLQLTTSLVNTAIGSPIYATDFDYPYVPEQDMYGNPVYPQVEITDKEVKFNDGRTTVVNTFEFAESKKSPQAAEYYFRTDNALPFCLNIDHKEGGDASVTVYQKYPDYEFADGYRWITLQTVSYSSKTKTVLITPTINGDGTYKIVVKNNNFSYASFADPDFDWEMVPTIVDYITITQEIGKHKNPAYTRTMPVDAECEWALTLHTMFGAEQNPEWDRDEDMFMLILGTVYVPAECWLPDDSFDCCYDRYGRPEPCHPVYPPDPPPDIEFPKKPSGVYYYNDEEGKLKWYSSIEIPAEDKAVSYYRHWYALGLYMEMHELVLNIIDPKFKYKFHKGFNFRFSGFKWKFHNPIKLGFKDVLGIREKPNPFKVDLPKFRIKFLTDRTQLRLEAGEPLIARAFEDFFIQPSDNTGVYTKYPPEYPPVEKWGRDIPEVTDKASVERYRYDSAKVIDTAAIESDMDDLFIDVHMSDKDVDMFPVTDKTKLGFNITLHSRWKGADLYVKDGYGKNYTETDDSADFMIHQRWTNSGYMTFSVNERKWEYGDHVLMVLAVDSKGNTAEAFIPFTVVENSVSKGTSEIDKVTGIASYTSGTAVYHNAECTVKAFNVEVPAISGHSGNDSMLVEGIGKTTDLIIRTSTSNGAVVKCDKASITWEMDLYSAPKTGEWKNGEEKPESIESASDAFPNIEKYTKLRFEYTVGNVTDHTHCLERANDGMICEVYYDVAPVVRKEIEKDFASWKKSLGLKP